MATPWIYINNTFEVNTRNSRPIAFSFFTDLKAKLEAASLTDPELLIYYGEFLPFFAAFEGIYMNLLMVEGEYEGRTLSFEDLLDNLNDTSHLRKWEGKVRGEFPEGSPTELEIFPNKRAPFQTGTYENRVLAVKTLAQKLTQYPVLATTQMEVQSFGNLMESTREAQQNHEGSLANLRTLYENQRIIIATETFGVYGRLCYKFRANRPMIANFFDLEILRDTGSGSSIEEGNIPGNTIQKIFEPGSEGYEAGAQLRIKNTTTGPAIGGLFFYTADNPTDAWSGQGNQLNPGQEVTITLTAATFKPYFLVQNQGPNEQSWEVEIL